MSICVLAKVFVCGLSAPVLVYNVESENHIIAGLEGLLCTGVGDGLLMFAKRATG